MVKLFGPPAIRARSLAWMVGSLLALAAVASAPTSARAGILVDPSTLQIGPQVGNTLDPVQIGTALNVTVTNVSNGADNLTTPWILILGIPNVTTTNAKITAINGNGSASNQVTGSFVTTMSSGQEAYARLSLDAGTNNSNSFTNWSGADSNVNGITATSFGLFEYKIPVTLAGGGTDTLTFNQLPVGTFIIAYGTTSTKIYDTPFTEAGLSTGSTSPVPEPSSLALALAGLGSFGLVGLRQLRRQRVAVA
jgi:hypothetical protein